MSTLERHWLLMGATALLGVVIATGTSAAAADDAAALARQSEAQLDPEIKARLAKADSGAKRIDVSGYPPAAQARYEVFSKTCTKCHSLARPINSQYALPSEWSRYVKRMMRKPGSQITKKKAKTIYEFLAYDSSQRKADLIAQKLAGLPKEARAKDEAKIAKLRALLEGGN